jgi:hypothetical protein
MREDPTPQPFAAKWEYPMFRRINGLVPEVKKGRPKKHTRQDMLDVLGDQALTRSQWWAEGGRSKRNRQNAGLRVDKGTRGGRQGL